MYGKESLRKHVCIEQETKVVSFVSEAKKSVGPTAAAT